VKRFLIVVVWRGFHWELTGRAKHPVDFIAGLVADIGKDAHIKVSLA
jgi:hypothetical protein